MTCVFCREDAVLSRSPLDDRHSTPDMHQVNCASCTREYHVCGTTTRMTTTPDYSALTDMMERIDYCNKNRIRYAIVYGTKQLGTCEHPY